MQALLLCYRDEPLRDFPLDARPLDVGRGAGCDVVVHDTEIAERQCLVERVGEQVRVHDLTSREQPVPLQPGAPFPVGARHTLVLLSDVPTRPLDVMPQRTEPVPTTRQQPPELALVVGRGRDARRRVIDGRPLRIGASPDADLVLHDRAVSAEHCRIDPSRDGLVVRDLGSRNGTWVDGVRVERARLAPGMRLRLGRTDVVLVARGRSGDARSDGLIAASAEMTDVLAAVERAARLKWPVLVQGETGAGKEGIARALHTRGPRSVGPFVALNAGALPRELIESELFGHEKGAFTGALTSHRGVFELADGGTLFLDEIGELPLEMQTRLLRVLENWEVRRIGATEARTVDVRLVCATHRDLRAMIARGTFRQDLYYRLVPIVIDVPPLRERPDDLRELAVHFLHQIAVDVGARVLTPAAVEQLLHHSWPGNARELKHVLCSAAAAASSSVLEADDIDRAIRRIAGPVAHRGSSPVALDAALATSGGNIAAAARALGLPRSTLRDRLRSR